MSDITTGRSAGDLQPEVPGSGGSTAEAAKEQAGAVASTAKEQTKAVAADAKAEARRLAEETRHRLRTQAAEQKSRLAETMRDVSYQLQGVARGEAPPQGLVADVTRQAADTTAQLARQLEAKQPEDLLDDVRRFARQKPGMFLLGAMAAGFVTGRLLRAADTGSVVEAAKSGAQTGGDGHESTQPWTASSTAMPAHEEGRLMQEGTRP